MAFAARLRSRPPAPTAERIIVFGAGDAGTQLIGRLAARSGAAYRPVAILDDDPLKRRLRICGVPVLGGPAQVAQVAQSTGARVLVIAIAGRSGRVIRDLTEEAERCGLAGDLHLLRAGSSTFVTAPVNRSAADGVPVQLVSPLAGQLWQSIRNDKVAAFAQQHPAIVTPAAPN